MYKAQPIRDDLYKYKCTGIYEYIEYVLNARFMAEGDCILINLKIQKVEDGLVMNFAGQ